MKVLRILLKGVGWVILIGILYSSFSIHGGMKLSMIIYCCGIFYLLIQDFSKSIKKITKIVFVLVILVPISGIIASIYTPKFHNLDKTNTKTNENTAYRRLYYRPMISPTIESFLNTGAFSNIDSCIDLAKQFDSIREFGSSGFEFFCGKQCNQDNDTNYDNISCEEKSKIQVYSNDSAIIGNELAINNSYIGSDITEEYQFKQIDNIIGSRTTKDDSEKSLIFGKDGIFQVSQNKTGILQSGTFTINLEISNNFRDGYDVTLNDNNGKTSHILFTYAPKSNEILIFGLEGIFEGMTFEKIDKVDFELDMSNFDGSRPRTYNNAGYVAFSSGNYEEAGKYYLYSLKLDHTYTYVLSNLDDLVKKYITNEDYNEASLLLDSIMEYSNKWYRYQLKGLAVALGNKNQSIQLYKDAKGYLEQANQMNPGNKETMNLIAKINISINDLLLNEIKNAGSKNYENTKPIYYTQPQVIPVNTPLPTTYQAVNNNYYNDYIENNKNQQQERCIQDWVKYKTDLAKYMSCEYNNRSKETNAELKYQSCILGGNSYCSKDMVFKDYCFKPTEPFCSF